LQHRHLVHQHSLLCEHQQAAQGGVTASHWGCSWLGTSSCRTPWAKLLMWQVQNQEQLLLVLLVLLLVRKGGVCATLAAMRARLGRC
jgi:hypothetical protein